MPVQQARPLQPTAKKYQQELNTIHNILHNNSFPIKPHKPPTLNPDKQITTHTTQKWACFIYIGKENLYITNMFKGTDFRITFRTTYTLANLLTHKDSAHDKYSLSGAYKLTCPDCHKTYVRQTGRQFSTRYKEHDSMVQPQHYLQFCTTPYRRSPFIWPHEQDHENSTMPQKRSTS